MDLYSETFDWFLELSFLALDWMASKNERKLLIGWFCNLKLYLMVGDYARHTADSI